MVSVGLLAAVLTTGAFVPQAWRTVRTRDVSGISAVYLVIFLTGITMWMVYGVLRDDYVIVGANVVTFALMAAIAAVKVSVWREDRVVVDLVGHPIDDPFDG